MKKSLAVLLTVMMVLSSMVTSAFVFTVGAEETKEAELLTSEGAQLATGTLPEVVTAAGSNSTGTTIRILKDFELTAQIKIPKTVTTVEGGGHTVYMAAQLSDTSGLAHYIICQGSVTFKKLNLNGQPMGYKEGDTPKTLGVGLTSGDTGAIIFPGGSSKLTLENCRMENFYTTRTGSCIYAGNTQTSPGNTMGIHLIDTVLTGNHSLGATYGQKGCAIRTRTGGTGTEVYVYGNTIVDGNFDKDGKPGNIFATTQGGTAPKVNEHTCVFVDGSFTGKIGLTSKFDPIYDEEGTLTRRGCVYFDEDYSGGLVYCMNSSVEKYLIPDANGYGKMITSQVSYHTAYDADGNKNGRAWSSGTYNEVIGALNRVKTAPRDESGNLIANPTEEQLKAAAALSNVILNYDFNDTTGRADGTGACYTIWGHGTTITRSAAVGVPMLRCNLNGTSRSYVIVKDVVFDGNCTVDEETMKPNATLFTGNWGGAVHMYNGTLEMSGVTIKNVFHTGASAEGGALFLHTESTAYLDSVTIENCYDRATSGKGGVMEPSDAKSKFYLSGDCKFANNYMMVFDGTKVTSRVPSDIYLRNASQLYLDGSFTGTLSISNQEAMTEAGVVFANLKEGDELNAGANFINVNNQDVSAKVVTSASNGYYPITWALPGAEEVKFTVKDLSGSKDLFTFVATLLPGDTLPAVTGCTWKNSETGATATTHTANATYVSDWTGANVEAVGGTASSAKTGTLKQLLADASLTQIHLLKDITATEIYSFAASAFYTVDGNGHTVSRGDGYTRTIFASNSAMNVTLRNFVFDGKKIYDSSLTANTDSVTTSLFNHTTSKSVLKLENCEIKNCYSMARGSVAKLANDAALYLKDVNIHDCWASGNGAIRAGYGGKDPNLTYSKIYLAGNTRICNDDAPKEEGFSGTNYILANGCSIGVYETFTGKVDVYVGDKTSKADNTPIASSGRAEDAFVAPGAEVKGTITLTNSNYTAYDKNGTLCWTSIRRLYRTFDAKGGVAGIDDGGYGDGLVLPIPYLVVGDKVQTADWYYNDGTNDILTNVTVKGVSKYFVREYDSTIEAQNTTQNTSGTFAGMILTANAGDTIELLMDVDSTNQINITNPIVIDGNDHKITLTTDNKGHMFDVAKSTSGLLISNLEMNGGATTQFVWEGPIAAANKRLINLNGGSSEITLNNCTLTGQRVYSTNEVNGTVVNPHDARVVFTGNTVITDNISYGVNSTDDLTLNSTNGTSAIRCNGKGMVSFSGKVLVKDNYTIKLENGKNTNRTANCFPGGGSNNDGYKRLLIAGDLAEGSEIWVDSTVGFMVAINPETGLPYTGISDGVRRGYGAKWPSYIVSTPGAVSGDEAVHTAHNGTVAAKYMFCPTVNNDPVQSVGALSAGGSITTDKLVLKILAEAVMADSEKTFVSVKIGDNSAIVKPLREFAVQANLTGGTKSTSGTTVIPVVVPMPQLADNIVISIYTEGNEAAPLKEIPYSAKEYVDAVIAKIDAGEITEKAVALKKALYALLNFGGYSQTYFGYNTEKLANAAIAGTENDMVAKKSYAFTLANVKATRSGTANNAVFAGVSLILEGEISLRYYFNLEGGTTASDFICKVGDVEYAIEKNADGRYYVEIAHIGTAKLGDRISLSITEIASDDTITYSCSPMTYINAVKNAEVSGSVTQELKDACDALFYYYYNAGLYFGFADATEATITEATSLRVYADPANSYGTLNGVTVA